uniref:Uncharacterized protein n=1 Tax=mine drainage metagenome TaxID=410659 RepID=E6Q0Q6_9ZZZZ
MLLADANNPLADLFIAFYDCASFTKLAGNGSTTRCKVLLTSLPFRARERLAAGLPGTVSSSCTS